MGLPRLIYTESQTCNPYFNLGFEKYLFDRVNADEIIFYLWQNEKTVVCGRNQNVYKECNLTALKAANGHVARRLSGGGAVFHDIGNLNFTFICRKENYNLQKQLDVIIKACKEFGIHAEKTGRNDITCDGKKFSGNAFYKNNTTVSHHGTIMIHVNFDCLSDFLNVDRSKLVSKGVSSVKSRVVNLSEFSENITVDHMKIALKTAFTEVYGDNFSESIILGSSGISGNTSVNRWSASNTSVLSMLKSISENKQMFSSDSWIYGKNDSFSNKISDRFSWGGIELLFNVKDGKIDDMDIFSDSLIPDFILGIKELLPGTPYSADALCSIVNEAAIRCGEDSEIPCRDIQGLICKSI